MDWDGRESVAGKRAVRREDSCTTWSAARSGGSQEKRQRIPGHCPYLLQLREKSVFVDFRRSLSFSKKSVWMCWHFNVFFPVCLTHM